MRFARRTRTVRCSVQHVQNPSQTPAPPFREAVVVFFAAWVKDIFTTDGRRCPVVGFAVAFGRRTTVINGNRRYNSWMSVRNRGHGSVTRRCHGNVLGRHDRALASDVDIRRDDEYSSQRRSMSVCYCEFDQRSLRRRLQPSLEFGRRWVITVAAHLWHPRIARRCHQYPSCHATGPTVWTNQAARFFRRRMSTASVREVTSTSGAAIRARVRTLSGISCVRSDPALLLDASTQAL